MVIGKFNFNIPKELFLFIQLVIEQKKNKSKPKKKKKDLHLIYFCSKIIY